MAETLTLCKTMCCAVAEINNLCAHETPKEAALAVAGLTLKWEAARYHGCQPEPMDPPPIITFTAVTYRFKRDHASGRTDNYGKAFADFIRKNKLGVVIKSPQVINHITKNGVTHWTWVPDYPALYKIVDKEE